MLSLTVFFPLACAVVLAALPTLPGRITRWAFIAATTIELGLTLLAWANYTAPAANSFAYEEQAEWIPGVGTSYHLGVDGLSLPLIVMTAVVFLAAAIYAFKDHERPRLQAVLFLFLESVSVGLFTSLDLILFFVFFDLSIVAMYFCIAGWGHGQPARSALKFFLYTFLGSLALLLGFIGLYVASDPHTFDMVKLVASTPLRDHPAAAGFVLAAILLGLAIKTPTFPFHTWLPPAHTDAPAIGSLVLAAVLLKMGTYGLVRIAMPMLPDTWQAWAPGIIAVGVVSVLWGALVALAQDNLKRMIAYTSVNHMGYIVIAVGVAGVLGDNSGQARTVAVAGAVTQMVSHGLLTGALFLLAGVMWTRTGSYSMSAYGGLAGASPRFTTLFAVAAFGSLGIPALSGFIAEFQIFAGTIATVPVTAVALVGILLTAALFLRALQNVFTGELRGLSVGFSDVKPHELVPVAGLLVLSLAIGIFPRPVLDLIEPAARSVMNLVGR